MVPGPLATAVCSAALNASLCGVVAPAGAATAARPAFSGVCTLTGQERFSPALNLTARAGTATVVASGTCTGRLVSADGAARLLSAPATYTQRITSASLSCIGGTASGVGQLSIGGQRLPVSVRENQLTAGAAMNLSAPGWSAFGIASASANPVGLALQCLGTGISALPIVVQLIAR